MREEYKAIVDAGFLLQIDDPRLVLLHENPRPRRVPRRRRTRIDALNHALRGIPPEQVRFHTCYGINMGRGLADTGLADIVDIMLKINAGAYSFEAANPRHEHEWKVWENVKLPEGKVLIPGVITHSTILVEHPELVAERINAVRSLVRRESVDRGLGLRFLCDLRGQQGGSRQHRLGEAGSTSRRARGWKQGVGEGGQEEGGRQATDESEEPKIKSMA